MLAHGSCTGPVSQNIFNAINTNTLYYRKLRKRLPTNSPDQRGWNSEFLHANRMDL